MVPPVCAIMHFYLIPDVLTVHQSTQNFRAEIHPIWYPVENEETDHDMWLEDLLFALDGGPL